MTASTWEDVRVDWIMEESREVVAPEQMAGKEVFHYSIPAIAEHGDGVLEDGETIASTKPQLRGGELLVSKLNPRKGHVLLTRPRSELTVCSGEFIVLRPTNCDPRFMYYFFNSELARQKLSGAVQSATKSHQRVNPADVTKMWLKIPPLPEQRAIADFLDHATHQVDRLSALRRRALQSLEAWTDAMINGLIGGSTLGFTPHGLPLPPPIGPATPLGVVASVQSGVTVDAGRAAGSQGVTLPYLRVANVQDGRLDLREVKTITVAPSLARSASLKTGDVLMTEGGDPDKLGRGTVWEGQISRCLHQNHIYAVRPDQTKVLPEFLALMTRSLYARAYFEVTASKTTGIASTSPRKVAAWRIPVPSLEMQRTTLETLKTETTRMDSLRTAMERQVSSLRVYRQALIARAVTPGIIGAGEESP